MTSKWINKVCPQCGWDLCLEVKWFSDGHVASLSVESLKLPIRQRPYISCRGTGCTFYVWGELDGEGYAVFQKWS